MLCTLCIFSFLVQGEKAQTTHQTFEHRDNAALLVSPDKFGLMIDLSQPPASLDIQPHRSTRPRHPRR